MTKQIIYGVVVFFGGILAPMWIMHNGLGRGSYAQAMIGCSIYILIGAGTVALLHRKGHSS